MFSVKEGICGAVPMIVMPFFAEQAHNVKQFDSIWVEAYQFGIISRPMLP